MQRYKLKQYKETSLHVQQSKIRQQPWRTGSCWQHIKDLLLTFIFFTERNVSSRGWRSCRQRASFVQPTVPNLLGLTHHRARTAKQKQEILASKKLKLTTWQNVTKTHTVNGRNSWEVIYNVCPLSNQPLERHFLCTSVLLKRWGLQQEGHPASRLVPKQTCGSQNDCHTGSVEARVTKGRLRCCWPAGCRWKLGYRGSKKEAGVMGRDDPLWWPRKGGAERRRKRSSFSRLWLLFTIRERTSGPFSPPQPPPAPDKLNHGV